MSAELVETRKYMLLNPFSHKAVGRKQAQGRTLQRHLQGSHPGVELLLDHFGFELLKTTVPQRARQGSCSQFTFSSVKGRAEG